MGLPGNPAAVLMTFSILCRPWLLKAQGAANLDVLTVQAKAHFSIRKPAVRQQYMQAQLTLDESGQAGEFVSQSKLWGVVFSLMGECGGGSAAEYGGGRRGQRKRYPL